MVHFWYIRFIRSGYNKMIYGAVEIAGEITREILADVYLQKERLPSERKLLERFGCARGTIRQALSLLEDRGLIVVGLM